MFEARLQNMFLQSHSSAALVNHTTVAPHTRKPRSSMAASHSCAAYTQSKHACSSEASSAHQACACSVALEQYCSTAQVPATQTAAQPSRRGALIGAVMGAIAVVNSYQPASCIAAASSDLIPAALQPDRVPDQSLYNPADPELRAAAALLQQALNAETVQEEERLWTQVIDKYQGINAIWMPDVVGRAYGNRGNARSRQGKLSAALSDYNAAIQLCPWSVDPVINRGVALEALGRWSEAAADYRAVISVAPNDPSAWNNLGNTYMGMKNWSEAETCFARAAQLAPAFSFAAANRTLAMYQLGRTEEAIREMRSLLRRYPDFPDMRAALTAAQWAAGREGDAETNWQRVEDPRYKDMSWLEQQRRWPPALVDSLRAFLQLKSV